MSALRRYNCPLNRLYNLPFTISSMPLGNVSGCPIPHGVLPSSTSNSPNDSQSPLLPTRMLTQTSDSEVNLLNRADTSPSPYAQELAEDDCDRRRVENWCGHANVVTLLSAFLLITVATFFSRYYMTSWSNAHDILAFYLAQVRKFFGGSSGGVITTITPPAMSFSKPMVTCAVVLTCVLWLASLTVGLGCVVLSTLLRQWIPRYALVDRPRYGLHSPELLSAFLMQRGSLRDVEAILQVLREWFLIAVFLFLWGLDIRLLHTANSPSPLIVFGLSFTFFTGLCLILAAYPQFPSGGVERIPV